MIIKNLILIMAMGCITACAKLPEPRSYELIKPGVITVNQFQVKNSSHWTQQVKGKSVSWTKDGTLLNELVFSEIGNGQDILGQTGVENTEFEFKSNRSMLALVELFVDALSIRNFYNVTLHSEHLFTVNAHKAIRFRLSYDTNSNVNYTAQAVFIKQKNTLHTLFCSAPSGHRFKIMEPYFSEILDSARLLKPTVL